MVKVNVPFVVGVSLTVPLAVLYPIHVDSFHLVVLLKPVIS